MNFLRRYPFISIFITIIVFLIIICLILGYNFKAIFLKFKRESRKRLKLEEKVENLEKENEKLKFQLFEAQEEIQRLEEENKVKDSKINILKNQVVSLKDETEKMRKKCFELKGAK